MHTLACPIDESSSGHSHIIKNHTVPSALETIISSFSNIMISPLCAPAIFVPCIPLFAGGGCGATKRNSIMCSPLERILHCLYPSKAHATICCESDFLQITLFSPQKGNARIRGCGLMAEIFFLCLWMRRNFNLALSKYNLTQDESLVESLPFLRCWTAPWNYDYEVFTRFSILWWFETLWWMPLVEHVVIFTTWTYETGAESIWREI